MKLPASSAALIIGEDGSVEMRLPKQEGHEEVNMQSALVAAAGVMVMHYPDELLAVLERPRPGQKTN